MSAGNLERDIAPVENSCDVSGLLGVQAEIMTYTRKGQRDVGAIDERYRVHHERHRNDAHPTRGSFGSHGALRQSPGPQHRLEAWKHKRGLAYFTPSAH